MAEKEKKFEVIPNEPKITQIEYAPRFAALCSIGEKPFHAEVEIKYQPDLLLLEFMSFEQWLLSFAVKEMTIEESCRIIFDELLHALGHVLLVVVVVAQTEVHAPVKATVTNIRN